MYNPSNPFSPEEEAALQDHLNSLSPVELDALKTELITQVLDSLQIFLTPRQAEIYAVILYVGGGSLRELAERAGVDRSNTYRRLRALIRKRLVRRTHRNGIAFYDARIN
jgi:DNA-binding MarR family transcriptional regulator